MTVLIVGFGKMGMLHAATLNSICDGCQLIVCDNSGLVKAALKKFMPGVRVYGSVGEALKAEPIKMAVVAAPNHAHYGIFETLYRRGIHVFVEKPFVADLQEARMAFELVSHATTGPQAVVPQVMVGYCLRFVPTFNRAKELLARRALGRVMNFEARMFSSDVEKAQGGWRFDKNCKGGGVLLDLGSHLIDLVRDLFGMPLELDAVTQRWHSRHVEDFFEASFFYEGFLGNVKACWSMPNIRKPVVQISIVGDKGTLTVSNDELDYCLESAGDGYEAGSHHYGITQLVQPVPFDLAGPFYTEQFVEFLKAIERAREGHRNTVEESLQDHQLIELIKSSQAGRRKVDRGIS